MKFAKISIAVVLSVALVAFIVFQIFFRISHPDYNGTLVIEGLTADVTVYYDEYGVPHIFAENEHDLFFAQGYITARERMFSMDVTRLAGRGELSSLFGEITIDDDKYLKTIGLYRAAEKEYESIPEDIKEVISAYTEGVNAYIHDTKHLPREYVILGAKPSPWLPEDSVVTALFMGFYLEDMDIDLPLYLIGTVVGEEKLSSLIPSYPDFAPPISPVEKGDSAFSGKTDSLLASGKAQGGGRDLLFPSLLPRFVCSNWMIFGPPSTTTGNVILTGSPDLTPSTPALFYLVHLNGGGYDVIGGSMPGAPGVSVLGYNGDIAWSSIDGMLDQCDFFIEKVNPDNPNQYLTENGWEDFETVTETLKIKTKEGMVEEPLEVKISRHGPIISDMDPLAPEYTAMMWVGAEGSGAYEGFLKINRAKNFDEFREAAHYIVLPDLNLAYGDTEGNFGYQYLGKPPIRKKGEGVMPVPGWNGEYDWTGRISPEELPSDLNPESGFAGGFNNLPKESYRSLTNWYYFERAVGFDEIMGTVETPLSPEEIRGLQLDSFSIVAQRWVPDIIAAVGDDADLAEYLALFEHWDYRLERESAAAALYSVFYYHLLKNTFEDEVTDILTPKDYLNSLMIPYLDEALAKNKDDGTWAWFDDVTTPDIVETKEDIVLASIRDAVDDLKKEMGNNPQKWEWGKLHTLTIAHPMGDVLPFFNVKAGPLSGDFFTLGASGWEGDDPYAVSYGGCIRMIIDFADPENSTIISPPGQSGHYLSPHYDDLVEAWITNEQIPLHFFDAQELDDVLILKKQEGS